MLITFNVSKTKDTTSNNKHDGRTQVTGIPNLEVRVYPVDVTSFIKSTQAAPDRIFKNHAHTQEEEDSYDLTKDRKGIVPTSAVNSAAHLIKGALGSGILGGPLAYSKAGVAVAIVLNILTGIYMGTCLYLLVESNKMLRKRTRKPFLSYADCAEAAVTLFPNKKVQRYSNCFRHTVDTLICLNLFGSCCTYQLVVAKSVKQLVEDNIETSLSAPPGYPPLRLYLVILLPFFIAICCIRQLKYLAPFTLAANGVIAMCITMAVYYCFQNNPEFKDLKLATDFQGILRFLGMSVFSMSCVGLVIPVEGSMKNPDNFARVLAIGIAFIIFSTVTTSFFGYAAFAKNPQAPFTINFPMETLPKVFKAAVAIMIVVTHGINFWAPFDLCWYYLKLKCNPAKVNCRERLFRALFVSCIGTFGIIFPTISGLMGFIGSFCIVCNAFIFPNIIVLLVFYERPGMGRFYWRLIRSVVFLIIGFFIWFCGSMVNIKAFVEVFSAKDAN